MEYKESFVFYESFYKMAQHLQSDQEKIKFYEGIMKYALYGQVPEFEEFYLQMAFDGIRKLIDNSISRYESSVKNGKSGGRPAAVDIYKLQQMKTEGKTQKECAQYFNVDVRTIQRYWNQCEETRQNTTKNTTKNDISRQNLNVYDNVYVDEDVNVYDNVNVDVSENENDIICSEPLAPSHAEQRAAFKLKDGTVYMVDDEFYDVLCDTYASVDVMEELKRIRAWCESNEQKRKTRRGAKAFVNSWMGRAAERMKPAKQIIHNAVTETQESSEEEHHDYGWEDD